ncbi:MAG: nucleotidyl transferase AbiEii/AbiGii toxin family protein [Verrucomicrobiales bacterium]|jgi:predicted nucleotidyltransferase|nr:nucleotidyl transferase AbiEii/AbiGii toxin family protein [Verrucomicrobiales bacterium]
MKNIIRSRAEYDRRQTEAARRVLVDVAQVLASYRDAVVLVGGWVPELLLPNAVEPHSGSIDVDLALNVGKLTDGRYAKLIQTLLDTGRYQQADDQCKLYGQVDLADGLGEIRVDVDFLKSPKQKLKKNHPRLLENFRPIDAEGCEVAFRQPGVISITGKMMRGADNKVEINIIPIEFFVAMKAYALAGRDKPKDAYDLCYCLENYAQCESKMADLWRDSMADPHIKKAIAILREKFAQPNAYGPRQVVDFYDSANTEERAIQAQRAFQLVQRFLRAIG